MGNCEGLSDRGSSALIRTLRIFGIKEMAAALETAGNRSSKRPYAAAPQSRRVAPLCFHPNLGVAREYGLRDVASDAHDHLVARAGLRQLRYLLVCEAPRRWPG